MEGGLSVWVEGSLAWDMQGKGRGAQTHPDHEGGLIGRHVSRVEKRET